MFMFLQDEFHCRFLYLHSPFLAIGFVLMIVLDVVMG